MTTKEPEQLGGTSVSNATYTMTRIVSRLERLLNPVNQKDNANEFAQGVGGDMMDVVSQGDVLGQVQVRAVYSVTNENLYRES
jgi:hypothetical protein